MLLCLFFWFDGGGRHVGNALYDLCVFPFVDPDDFGPESELKEIQAAPLKERKKLFLVL